MSTPCHCPWTTFGARNLDNCHKLQVYKNGQFFWGGQKKRGGPRGALSTPRRVDAEFLSAAYTRRAIWGPELIVCEIFHFGILGGRGCFRTLFSARARARVHFMRARARPLRGGHVRLFLLFFLLFLLKLCNLTVIFYDFGIFWMISRRKRA